MIGLSVSCKVCGYQEKKLLLPLYCLKGWELGEGQNDGRLHIFQQYCKCKASGRN